MQRTFVKTLVFTCLAFTLIFGVEALIEWMRLGEPAESAMSWAGVNNAKLVDVLSPVARAYNNSLAMLIAAIGLAIPLTANMHTPKLISIFFEDWVNRVVLFVMAFGAANVLFVAWLVGPTYAPLGAIRFAVGFAIFGWALSIPYFFYVIRFLDPSEIITRLSTRMTAELARGTTLGLDVDRWQDKLRDGLEQIGTIVIKSLDRSDRGVAVEGVWAFKRLADGYGALKPQLPEATFAVDRHDFVGLSAEALEMLNEHHTWFERQLLNQLLLGFRAALTKASDTVASMSDATRVILAAAHRRGDAEATRLALYALNSYVRAAIHAKNVHAIYDVFYQYRIVARELREDPAILRAILRAFREYAGAARDAGLHFAAQLAAFDLGSIARRAYEVESPCSGELLDGFLAISHAGPSGVWPLVVKAKLMMGGFLVDRGASEAAASVAENLRGVPREVLERAERELLAADRSYIELTARQVDLEFVAPERRAGLTAFVASCASAAT